MANSIIKKDIKYLGKDFNQFRENLINFVKSYYQDTFNDFDPNDPAMMFVEISSYVGDVLSFYLDTQIKESMILNASEKKNILSLAQGLGYKPNIVSSAHTKLDVYQLVPSIGSGTSNSPDYNYALKINAGMRIGSSIDTSVEFRTTEELDFGFSSSYSPTDVSVYSIDENTDETLFYLLKKQINIESGTKKQSTFSIGSPERYKYMDLSDTNIISIESIIDSDNNNWYEVDYLAQDTIFEKVNNISTNDPELSQFRNQVPYLLKLKHVPKRFVTRYNKDYTLRIQFGSGIVNDIDEEYTPNPDNIGLTVPTGASKINYNWDVSNFMFTDAYGQVPSDTTLTVTYIVGNGISDNAIPNSLRNIIDVEFNIDDSGLDYAMLKKIKSSLNVNNPYAATGAKVLDDVNEIKNNALANLSAQGRMVSMKDYIFRTYNMPPIFGSIAKAYVVQDKQLYENSYMESNTNPFALNLYVLSYDSNKYLTTTNTAIKENLKVYLNKYRMVTDSINIKNAYIVNIQVYYQIVPTTDYANNEVLLYCNEALIDFFNIEKWEINQPINKSNIIQLLSNTKGVQSVIDIDITNIFDDGYSSNVYDINTATRNGIIYPSLDTMIFEVKYPSTDIYGKIINQ